MTPNWRHLLIRLNTRAARVPGAVSLAKKVRNHCDLLIANAMTDGRSSDMATNGELWLLERLAPIATFVDVGANVGEWTARVLHLSPDARGVAFEPIAEFAESIEGADVVCAAAGDDSSPPELSFFRHETAPAWSSLFEDVAGTRATTKLTVPVTTVDRELAARKVAHVDLMKIDAEGYDLHVLRGARGLLSRQAVDVVQFEYSRGWLYARSTLAEAINQLEANDYRVYLLGGGGISEYEYSRYGEFFAYSNFVAASPAGRERLAAR